MKRFCAGFSVDGLDFLAAGVVAVDLDLTGFDDSGVLSSSVSRFRFRFVAEGPDTASFPNHDLVPAGFSSDSSSAGIAFSSSFSVSFADLFFCFPLNASAFCFRFESFVDIAKFMRSNVGDRRIKKILLKAGIPPKAGNLIFPSHLSISS